MVHPVTPHRAGTCLQRVTLTFLISAKPSLESPNPSSRCGPWSVSLLSRALEGLEFDFPGAFLGQAPPINTRNERQEPHFRPFQGSAYRADILAR